MKNYIAQNEYTITTCKPMNFKNSVEKMETQENICDSSLKQAKLKAGQCGYTLVKEWSKVRLEK